MLIELVLRWMVELQDPSVSPKRAASYGIVAAGIVRAAEENPVFGDAEHTAAILTSVAFYESGFTPDALGDCKKGLPRTIRNCRSVGAFQINKMHAPTDQLSDPWEAPRTALRLMAQSKEVCIGRPAAESLGQYAAGGPGCRGVSASRIRYMRATRLLTAKPGTTDRLKM